MPFMTSSTPSPQQPHQQPHQHKPATAEVEDYDYEALPAEYSLGHNMLAGAFAGIMEHTVMYPIDLLKTRMQVLNPSTNALYSGISNAVTTISRIEGWTTLWRGISSVIVGAGPAHAVYFATYEAVKDAAGGNEENGYHSFAAGLSGACATIASDALMNPFDVVKQRMQVHGSTYPSILSCIGHISRHEGLRAFYISYPTTLCMTVPFTATQFVAYDSITRLMNPTRNYDPFTHCMAGGAAGAVAAAVTTPLDVIKTVLQTRTETYPKHTPSASPAPTATASGMLSKINGPIQAGKLIQREYGWRGFFRGMKPRIIVTMPSTAICWTSYEMAKAYFKHTVSRDGSDRI